jgi:hypothetical protein
LIQKVQVTTAGSVLAAVGSVLAAVGSVLAAVGSALAAATGVPLLVQECQADPDRLMSGVTLQRQVHPDKL